MGNAKHLSNGTLILLLISLANLCFLAVAVFYHWRERAVETENQPDKSATYGLLAVGLASCSQLLYLALGFAWWFDWMRFYPGNPIQSFEILAGLALSAGALIMAAFGRGLNSAAAFAVGIATIGLWLLSAIASVFI